MLALSTALASPVHVALNVIPCTEEEKGDKKAFALACLALGNPVRAGTSTETNTPQRGGILPAPLFK